LSVVLIGPSVSRTEKGAGPETARQTL
jgi:hypothetical protein